MTKMFRSMLCQKKNQENLAQELYENKLCVAKKELERQEALKSAERSILRLTNHQVQGLQVELMFKKTVISGYCKTFYTKQLAQTAIMKFMKNRGCCNEIINNIQVR